MRRSPRRIHVHHHTLPPIKPRTILLPRIPPSTLLRHQQQRQRRKLRLVKRHHRVLRRTQLPQHRLAVILKRKKLHLTLNIQKPQIMHRRHRPLNRTINLLRKPILPRPHNPSNQLPLSRPNHQHTTPPHTIPTTRHRAHQPINLRAQPNRLPTLHRTLNNLHRTPVIKRSPQRRRITKLNPTSPTPITITTTPITIHAKPHRRLQPPLHTTQ